MNAGVLMTPCGVVRTPARARPKPACVRKDTEPSKQWTDDYPVDVVEDAFRTQGDNWQPVSQKRLTRARRVVLILVALPFLALLIAFATLLAPPVIAVVALAVLLVIAGVWAWVLIGRRVRSFAYTERANDLLVTSGILFRRLVIVPYGRMQLVDVKAGPIDRWFGIANVQLHTAAATTDAKIPGLEPHDAAVLRDRLAAIGEQRSSGL
jgi:membrane protein YdbS with pleckstrin-like domain